MNLTNIKNWADAARRRLLGQRSAIRASGSDSTPFRAHYNFVCRDASGRIKWTHDVDNVITNNQRNFFAQQALGTSGLGTTGMCNIALSADAFTYSATSTGLTTEISTNGGARAAATVTLPSGQPTTTSSDTGGVGLNAASGGTTINVASTSGWVTGTTIQIESEQVTIGTVASATQCTGCTRAANGTSQAAHANGTSITNVNTTTLTHTFTIATGALTIQCAALFSLLSGGTMGSPVSLGGSRTLLPGDTLAVTISELIG